MNRISDGDRSTLLSFLSCVALQSDEIIGILKVLFRYVGIGTRLALTSMDWMNTREAVILVPDPIVYEPVVNIGKTGLLCEPHVSCKTVTCHGLCVVEPVYIRPYCAADGGTGGELRCRASLTAVSFSRHISLASLCAFVLLCGAADVQRKVDQDPEDGLKTQCNGGLCVRLYSFWLTFFDHKTTVAGGAAAAGGAGGALRAGASLVTVYVLTGHICSVSLFVFTCRRSETSTFGLCTAADVRRSGPGPGRRAHEAVQRATLCFFIMCCVWESPSQVDGGWLLHRAAQAQHRQAL